MQTFALFEDQTSARVLCDFFATDPGDDPVRLVFPDLEDTRLRHSAVNGCLATYQILYQLGYLDPGEHFCLSFQFSEHRRFASSHGSSAGLAFALKFATELYQLKTSKNLGRSIAATGAISDGTRAARVEAVHNCANKVLAALEVLSAGDLVFFPAENGLSPPKEVQRLAAEREIRLVPVATLAEALQVLLPPTPAHKLRRQGKRILAGLSALALVGLLGLAVYSSGKQTARGFARRMQTAVDGQPLSVKGALHYRSRSNSGSRTFALLGEAGERLRLYSGDLYKFSLVANDSSYLYLFQADSRGQVERWPDPLPQAAPLFLDPAQETQIPAKLEDWLILDQQIGEDVFTVLALRARDPVLDSLYIRFRQAPESRKVALRAELFAYIADLPSLLPPGEFHLQQFTLRHEPLPSSEADAPSSALAIEFPLAVAANTGDQLDIYVSDSSAWPGRRLTADPASDFYPAWSPDGRRLAFTSDRNGNNEIWVIEADGTGERSLTHHPAEDQHATWSPDGQFIAFSSNRGKADPDDFDLYLMRADGTGITPIDTSSDRAEQPAWSPDGRRIAYVRSTTFDDHRLWLAAPDGSVQTPLGPSIFPVNATAPAWSPDGARIFFVGTVPGLPSRVGCLDANGAGLLFLGVEGDDTCPALSPDGHRILVCRQLSKDLFFPTILDLNRHLNPILTMRTERAVGLPPTFSWAEGFRHLGQAALGTSVTRQMRLVNHGRNHLEVTGVEFDDLQFDAGKQRFILDPHEVRSIDLVFSPQKTGVSYSTLKISTDIPAFPGIRLIVNGTGTPGPASTVHAGL